MSATGVWCEQQWKINEYGEKVASDGHTKSCVYDVIEFVERGACCPKIGIYASNRNACNKYFDDVFSE